MVERNPDIYVYDLARETPTRFTLDPANDIDPIWTPDGERVVWSSGRGGVANVWWKAADGTGEAEPLTSDPEGQGVSSISPDGKTLLFWQGRAVGFDVGIMSLDDPETTDWLFENPFRLGHPKSHPTAAGSPTGPTRKGRTRSMSGRFRMWTTTERRCRKTADSCLGGDQVATSCSIRRFKAQTASLERSR